MYRILVAPAAQRQLRSLTDARLQQVGQLVAAAAEHGGEHPLSPGARAPLRTKARLSAPGLRVVCSIDGGACTMTLLRVAYAAPLIDPRAALAAAAVTAPEPVQPSPVG